MAMIYRVYTDGACSNNQAPGGQPGGWAAVFEDGTELSGAESKTTNNRMELTAAIQALLHTEPESEVWVHSDSAYVVNAFNQDWFGGWFRRGWINAKGQPVENQDLWKRLWDLSRQRRVHWVKIKGHAGHVWNERADALAVMAMRQNMAKQNNS